MGKERAMRPERRAPPFATGRPQPLVAGRTRRRMPRVRMPAVNGWSRRASLLAVAVVGLTVGGWWVYQSPLLAVQDVTVEGNSSVSTDLVLSIAGIEGNSIVRPGFGGAEERLIALPLVKDVQISRDWPNGARITVVERTPWGQWQIGDARYTIDVEGVVLELPAPLAGPVIKQTDASSEPVAPGDVMDAGAVAVAQELVSTTEQTLGRSVLSLEFSQATGVTAILDGNAASGLRVAFGDAQALDFKVAALFAVLQDAEDEGRTLSRVDLRFGDRVAVQ
ncbi:MAG: FtsQ-type POTRA domain-containing protein [Dehalococcoidia bacterium]